jgi:hypothetical protein
MLLCYCAILYEEVMAQFSIHGCCRNQVTKRRTTNKKEDYGTNSGVIMTGPKNQSLPPYPLPSSDKPTSIHRQ